jgi:hypothetical protein
MTDFCLPVPTRCTGPSAVLIDMHCCVTPPARLHCGSLVAFLSPRAPPPRGHPSTEWRSFASCASAWTSTTTTLNRHAGAPLALPSPLPTPCQSSPPFAYYSNNYLPTDCVHSSQGPSAPAAPPAPNPATRFTGAPCERLVTARGGLRGCLEGEVHVGDLVACTAGSGRSVGHGPQSGSCGWPGLLRQTTQAPGEKCSCGSAGRRRQTPGGVCTRA